MGNKYKKQIDILWKQIELEKENEKSENYIKVRRDLLVDHVDSYIKE